MTKTPKFSILLPTYNRVAVLELAINSVLSQTLEDYELLVVGDGCTDGSARLVDSYSDNRIKWFDFPKAQGFGYSNRNLALQASSGELVAFLGHDNLLFPDHLELMSSPFNNPGVQIAYSRPLWIRDDGLIIPFFVNLNLPASYSNFLHNNNVLPATCVVHRRTCFDAVGYWPEHIEQSGDWDLWKRILREYGPQSLRMVRQPTNLHFRADWRDKNNWAPQPLPYLAAIHDAGRFWPKQLNLNLKSDDLPQVQVSNLLAEKPETFVAAIRGGVTLVQDAIAWNSGFDANFDQ